MRENDFRAWLTAQAFDSRTVSTQISQARRLAKYFGDLDRAFDKDLFRHIRETLRYSKEDERANAPNPAPFPIKGDLYSNLSSYQTTLNYYHAFRTRASAGRQGAPEQAEDAPLIDLNEPALKEIIARAKERGHVTHDEVSDALPQDQVTAQQIEDVVSALSEMGITVAEKEEAPQEPAATEMWFDDQALEAMREVFLARFPDFEKAGFEASEGAYWDEERRYKQVLIDRAAAVVGQTDLGPTEVGKRILDILRSKDSSLLDWRELRRIEEVRSETPGLIERALGDLVLSAAPSSNAVGRFVEEVAEAYCRGQERNMPYAHLRAIPTTALALVQPENAVAVRHSVMQTAGKRLLNLSLFKNAPMTGFEYVRTLIMARTIAARMREEWHWRPRDLWDVQGFLWVVTAGHEAKTGADLDEVTLDASAERRQDDRYRTQTDDPARFDALERGPFAAVLAARIVEIRNSPRSADDQAFMVHLHGPWGSGKSSILNLIEEELKHPKEGKPWLVVPFNAWKHQRMRPPWWALMTAIYHGAIHECAASADERERYGDRFVLWKLWWSWRWKAEVFPILLVALLVAGLTFALLGTDMGSAVETLSKVGATALVVLAAVYTYARLMIFGSQKAVQTYADLTTDPYRRIVDLFNRLVKEIKVPLVVFVDDLDRCDCDYVVELLEGIQTLFRQARVTYVVAADRKWICSSFEKKYGDFAGSIGEPCRPLGYLFLDKLFQISAEMPRLTREIQASYLAALLREESPRATTINPAVMAAAEKQVSGISNEADLQRLLADAEAEDLPAEDEQESLERHRALRAAAAMQITSAEAARETEHRLQKFSHLLEPNPRSMKRLVNAVGMAQARGILEGRSASPETRARWAMLSLRWPIFAEFIADNPELIRHWTKKNEPANTDESSRPTERDASWPQAIQDLYGNIAVMAVVGAADDDGALTSESLAPLLA